MVPRGKGMVSKPIVWFYITHYKYALFKVGLSSPKKRSLKLNCHPKTLDVFSHGYSSLLGGIHLKLFANMKGTQHQLRYEFYLMAIYRISTSKSRISKPGKRRFLEHLFGANLRLSWRGLVLVNAVLIGIETDFAVPNHMCLGFVRKVADVVHKMLASRSVLG